MPRVHLPQLLRPLAEGAPSVEVEGVTLRAVIEALDRRYPGLGERITENGEIRPEVMVAIDGDETRDLNVGVPATSEVHVLPAIAGGA
jgi:molybdopterin converting factor small subunit